MPSYIAIVHKDPDNCYGVRFPDVPEAFRTDPDFNEAAEGGRLLIVPFDPPSRRVAAE